MRYLFLALAILSNSVMADMVASKGESSLRLLNEPCTSESILTVVKPEYRGEFKRAVAVFGKVTMGACWIDTMRGAYFVIFDDGDQVAFPVSAFIETPGA